MIFKIKKDITICYDGIHPIELKEGESLDIKALLPNPEKAEKFRDRLVGLGVVGALNETANETAEKEVEVLEDQEPEPENAVDETAEKPKRGRKSKKD